MSVNLITQKGTVELGTSTLSAEMVAQFVTDLGFPSKSIDSSDEAPVALILRLNGPCTRKNELQWALERRPRCRLTAAA